MPNAGDIRIGEYLSAPVRSKFALNSMKGKYARLRRGTMT